MPHHRERCRHSIKLFMDRTPITRFLVFYFIFFHLQHRFLILWIIHKHHSIDYIASSYQLIPGSILILQQKAINTHGYLIFMADPCHWVLCGRHQGKTPLPFVTPCRMLGRLSACTYKHDIDSNNSFHPT